MNTIPIARLDDVSGGKTEQAETLGEELSRLVAEYQTGNGSDKEEAWNLIADFSVENCEAICAALNAPDYLTAASERIRVLETEHENLIAILREIRVCTDQMMTGRTSLLNKIAALVDAAMSDAGAVLASLRSVPVPAPGVTDWRLIEEMPDTIQVCWIGHAPSSTMLVARRDITPDAWWIMWSERKIPWTPTHWQPLPEPPALSAALQAKE